MQVTNSRAKVGEYTTYTLKAMIEQHIYVAQAMIHDVAYDALNVKDKNDLIESQLWQQLMHTIEHHLRKTAYANSKDSDRRH